MIVRKRCKRCREKLCVGACLFYISNKEVPRKVIVEVRKIIDSNNNNFIESPICMGKERLKAPGHPTQKPLKILKQLIQVATEPGHLILDPFMGVGSSGVAALELGRRFAGIELDLLYFEAATRRIAAVRCPLFAHEERQALINQARAAMAAQGWTLRIRTRRAREYMYAVRRVGMRIEERYLGSLDKFISGQMQVGDVAQHLTFPYDFSH
jgi:hypothetical protein